MTEHLSDFIRTIVERGFLHQCTDLESLDALSAEKRITAYIGFDCTAPSLHVGNLMSIMLLRWLQRTGHKPIVLMGGGTTKVGDPSGRDTTRKLLDTVEIENNMSRIKRNVARFLDFAPDGSDGGPTDAIMVNNADWLDELSYIPFLRDYGRHFSVNRMLGFESVKLRLDRQQPLSFLEFNYMVLQAFDFLELSRRHHCVLQMGGSDQWGNIVAGADLARRTDDRALYGLTTPLLTTASGAKMGKTSDGAIWLDGDMVPAYDYWQFWRNSDDTDVGLFLRLFTELPLDEIARLEQLEGVEINAAKKELANHASALCHGDEAASAAAETAEETFENRGAGDQLPVVEVPRTELEAGIAAFEILRRAGLAASNSDARRLIKGGGARINDVVMDSETQEVGVGDIGREGTVKLSAGKKRHALVRPV
ncbi:MAG: tyrosine--tRNA ligase [Rhodospirillales bacterium]|nr:tyrosine--tRNA ligase [Rhodospirillales bacterium]